jgi:hypothetical protein
MQSPLEVVDDSMPCIIGEPQEPVECDGYFSRADGEVILKDEQGRAVMVKKEFGEGLIIATTVHEFPSADFLGCAVDQGKNTRL